VRKNSREIKKNDKEAYSLLLDTTGDNLTGGRVDGKAS
jgi:hypothetical protein